MKKENLALMSLEVSSLEREHGPVPAQQLGFEPEVYFGITSQDVKPESVNISGHAKA